MHACQLCVGWKTPRDNRFPAISRSPFACRWELSTGQRGTETRPLPQRKAGAMRPAGTSAATRAVPLGRVPPPKR